jgi:hypothetical protein
MSLDVLRQILRLAKRRGLTNDKLLIDIRPFKNVLWQKTLEFGGEGGIRTLGTGYPVRQISNPNRRFHSVRALETEREESPCRRATSGALCVPLG